MSYLIWRIKLWIRTEARPVHWILPGLVALIVLGTVCPRLLWTFAHTDDGMTDGEHDYAYLYREYGWDYRGRFRYFMGWAEDGRPVYAADEEGMIIKKREKWYQDMPYRPLYRADLSFPDIYTDECEVSIRLTTEKKEIFYETSYGYTRKWIDLSPDGARAFQSVMKQLRALKEAGTARQDYPKTTEDKFVRFVEIENPAFPEFVYQPNVKLFWIDGTIYAWFEKEYCKEVDPDSALYAELKQYHDLYR